MPQPHTDLHGARRWFLGMAGACMLVALLLFGRSLSFGFVDFDDNILVYDNPAIRLLTPGSLFFIFTHFDPELYIPLTFLSYQLNHLFGGLEPFGYHLANILLHAANALMAGWIAKSLSKNAWVGCAAGMLFLVHPLQAETVAWVSARKDLLSTFFALASFASYRGWRTCGERRRYIGSIVLFALGLLAKVSIAPLPLLLLLADWRERRLDRRSFLFVLPHLALSVVFFLIAMLGKQQALAGVPAGQTLLVAIKTTVFLLGKFLLPVNLSVLYPFTGDVALASPAFFVPLIVLAGMSIVAAVSLRWTREVVFGLLFFALSLAPSLLNYAKTGDIYLGSDRYMYLPLLGLCFLLAAGLHRGAALIGRHRSTPVLIALTLLIALPWSTLTFFAVGQWQNTRTLFEHVLATHPDSQLAQNKIGSMLWREGRKDEAVAYFERSLEVRPNERAYYNLGLIALEAEQYDEALRLNLESLKLNPNYAPAHVNAGFLLWQAGDSESAKQHFRSAIAGEPFAVDARINLASILLEEGAIDEAVQLLQDALALDPANADALMLLGQIDG